MTNTGQHLLMYSTHISRIKREEVGIGKQTIMFWGIQQNVCCKLCDLELRVTKVYRATEGGERAYPNTVLLSLAI